MAQITTAHVAKDPTRLAPQQFQRIRVLFLGHDTRSGAWPHTSRQALTVTVGGANVPVRVAQRDEAEFGRRIHDQVFRQPTHVHHRQTRPHEKLDDKVAIADAPHAVLG